MVTLRASAWAFFVLASLSVVGAFVSGVLVPASTETAVANGDTRTLHLYHTHTGETIDATFRVDGRYDQDVLRQLNHFLRDWRNNDEISMDPRLFDAVWEAYRSAGATDRVQIYSAYRSPETNAMLRRRSKAVAEHSQHMLGKAMDTTMPGFPMDRVRDAGMKLQHGGVGWYPSANFVHLDVGGVRSWPRMPYEQLASLFPDGKTVHIASNGQTLPGYEQARQELAQRGQGDLPPSQESGGFFAWLFGGGSNTAGAAHEDEEDRRVAVAVAPQPTRPEQPAPQPQPQQTAVPPAIAYAETEAVPSSEPEKAARAAEESGNVKVASLETDAAPARAALPLPPRRPAALAGLPDIPLPPIRPDRLARSQDSQPRARDEIAGLITSTPSGVPMLRRSSLPAIITQGAGDHRRLPGQALAFATDAVASDRPPGLRATPAPIARPVTLAKPMGLRMASRKAPAASPVVATEADGRTGTGSGLTGLRKAARMLDQKASL